MTRSGRGSGKDSGGGENGDKARVAAVVDVVVM